MTQLKSRTLAKPLTNPNQVARYFLLLLFFLNYSNLPALQIDEPKPPKPNDDASINPPLPDLKAPTEAKNRMAVPVILYNPNNKNFFEFIDINKMPPSQLIPIVERTLLNEGTLFSPTAPASNFFDIRHAFKGDHPWNPKNPDQPSPLVEKYKNDLALLIADISERKKAVFNRNLKSFDERVQAFRLGNLPFPEYVNFIVSYMPPISRNVQQYLSARESAPKVNFQKAEEERKDLLQQLLARMTDAEKIDLFNKSLASRTGQIKRGQYYADLLDLSKKRDIKSPSLKELQKYIRLAYLFEPFDEALQNDLSDMEKGVYEQLSQQENEKKLIEEDYFLYLISKLLTSELTKREWEELKKFQMLGYKLHPKRASWLRFDFLDPRSMTGNR